MCRRVLEIPNADLVEVLSSLVLMVTPAAERNILARSLNHLSEFICNTVRLTTLCDVIFRERVSCVWVQNIMSGNKKLYPVWRAHVRTDLTISVQYQRYNEVQCGTLVHNSHTTKPVYSIYASCISSNIWFLNFVRGLCGDSCRKHMKSSSVFVTSYPPKPINPETPGHYGHANLSMKRVRLHPFQEDVYCKCVN